MRRPPPPYIPPPQPIRKDGHQSPPSRHLSPIRSSSADNFLGRNNQQNALGFSHSSYASNYSVHHHSSSSDKTRTGIMMYNPMWNS